MATIRFKGSRAEARAIAGRLGGILSGRLPDEARVGEGFRSAIGFGALTDIKEAFVTKARGGRDEMGIRWKPLKPSTIANRRVGAGRQPTEIAERRRIQRRETNKALRRFRLSLPEGEARRRANIVGGLRATQLTGKTKIETLGGRQVEILRDTGVLLNSITPRS